MVHPVPATAMLPLTTILLSNLLVASAMQGHIVRVQHTALQWSLPPRVIEVQGSGICINYNCSIIATAHHIQNLGGKGTLDVVGSRTQKVLSPATDRSPGSTDVPTEATMVSYDAATDISFIYTRKPVPHKVGVPYTYISHVGQSVVVAGYRHHKFEATPAHIIGVNMSLEVGRTHLGNNLLLDIAVKPGASGSAVLDEQGNLLGMVTFTGRLRVADTDTVVTVALPVRTIAVAFVKLDPAVGSAIFDDIPEEEPRAAETLSMAYQEIDLPEDTSPIIPKLVKVSREVPDAVSKLQTKAAAASERMVNIIAEQCMVQGTRKPLCHELSILDGRQTFRELKKGGRLGKTLASFPVQSHGVWTESDWGDTLSEIADNPWIFQGSVGEQYLFTNNSGAGDDRCHYTEISQAIPLLGGGFKGWAGSVSCVQYVLTDKDFNAVAVFKEMWPPPDQCQTEILQTAMYYDWVALDGLKSPVLLPTRERIAAKVRGQMELWYTTISWAKYRKFRAEHRVSYPQTVLLPAQ